MAADVLSQAGARVVLYEHKPSPARKFLMAGRGGLNITHSEPAERFLARYGAAATRLAPILADFPPQRLRDFCAALGEDTFVGSSGRVFPRSFKASPLLRAWLARLAAQGVEIRTRCAFEGFDADGALLLRGPEGAVACKADAIILACGGASWLRLGSDGTWRAPLAAQGVAIAPLAPSNCGALIDWSAHFLGACEGQPLKTIRVTHGEDSARGDLVVTRRGLEGGPVYALSANLGRAVSQGGAATLHLDLRPDVSIETLTQKLARGAGKQSLSTFLRKALSLSKTDIALLREAAPGGFPREPAALAALVKGAPLRVVGVAGLERAISTAGGVSFDELTDDLMLSKLPGVFAAGEMLDYDAPTGGYLLQAAFATGARAAQGALRYMGR